MSIVYQDKSNIDYKMYASSCIQSLNCRWSISQKGSFLITHLTFFKQRSRNMKMILKVIGIDIIAR